MGIDQRPLLHLNSRTPFPNFAHVFRLRGVVAAFLEHLAEHGAITATVALAEAAGSGTGATTLPGLARWGGPRPSGSRFRIW